MGKGKFMVMGTDKSTRRKREREAGHDGGDDGEDTQNKNSIQLGDRRKMGATSTSSGVLGAVVLEPVIQNDSVATTPADHSDSADKNLKDSSSIDYSGVPVSSFGMRMLRKMGWKEP
jgi:hypothetical protein